MVSFRDIAAQRGARGQERYTHRSCLQGERHGEIRQVENFHSILFHRPPKIVGRAHYHVADPGSNGFFYASRSNHLIKENVGNRTNKRKVAFLLTYDFVCSREWDHLLQL